MIKRLVKERWLTWQPHQTIVERLGGHPEHLLEDAPPDLSERANRKKAIANYLQKKYPQFYPQLSRSDSTIAALF